MRIRRRRQAVHPLVASHANAVNTIGLLLRLLWFCCYSITPVNARKGKLELSNECETVWRRSPVRIDDVYLVCDSPGAYYGGKSAYQNSVTCRQGDRAKVALDCMYQMIDCTYVCISTFRFLVLCPNLDPVT